MTSSTVSASVFSTYRSLSFQARRLCHVSWAYKALEAYVGTFAGIALYVATRDVGVALAYIAATVAGISVAYAGGALLASRTELGSRRIFSWTFLTALVAFALFLAIDDAWIKALSFGWFYGLCHGSFYLGFFHNMLLHTHDSERDAYSTVRMTGSLLLDIAMPFLAAFTFMASEALGFADHSLLAAIILAAFSLFGLAWFRRVFVQPDRLPALDGSVFRSMLGHANFPSLAAFFMVLRMDLPIATLSLPLLWVLLFGKPADFGLALGMVTIVTIVFTLLTHRHRTPARRSAYARLGYALEFFALACAGVATFFPSLAFGAYIVCILLTPFAKNISWMATGLYELRMAEMLGFPDGSTRMEAQVLRSLLITLGRTIVVWFLFLSYLAFPEDPRMLIASGFALWAIALLVQFLLIRFLDAPVRAPAMLSPSAAD